ncbi:MAG TPA: isoprenylcysteine carboxylmethyltransferase family protein [Vicinamibacterales bacterium]|nr:isoprenylcysteine carboxylmethyltransferase family protein [Vicinamibacterales bacterium]
MASLGYFLFSYAVRFGVVVPGPVRASSVVWDIALFSVFALHHSVLAREPIRNRVMRAVPQLERSLYVWVASLLLVLVCWLWQPVAGVVWNIESGAAIWALRALQIAGIGLSLYSAALIDIWELAGVRQPNSTPDLGDRANPGSRDRDRVGSWEFSTRGPYGWVRHPIYLGWFLLVFAVATMTMTQFVFAVVSCAYVLIAIPFEERSLRNTTGGAYERYVTKVPWKLVPRVF